MAKDSAKPVSSFETENTGGVMSGFLAEEDDFDRRALLRLGTWGVASVGAVIVAILANQSSVGVRREQVAAADLARQSLQIQSVAKESQNETRRLASAIDTLNGDRDRLYSRVSVLEQGLDTVTGSIARQTTVATAPPSAPASAIPASATAAPSAIAELPQVPQNPTPPPAAAPVATTSAIAEKPKVEAKPPEPAPAVVVASVAPSAPNTPAANIPTAPAANTPAANATPANTPAADPSAPPPATPFMAAKSMMGPPDAAAGKLVEPATPAKSVTVAPAPDVVASAPPKENAERDPSPARPPAVAAVQRTEFAVDVGGANSVSGLRALWQGLLKSRSNAPLAALHPIIVVKESNTGLGMQLRLVAGPLSDAAAAAKICAAMIENNRSCETTVFDGQRLSMKAEDQPAPAKMSSDKPNADKPGSEKSGSDKVSLIGPEPDKHAAEKPVSARPGSGKTYSYRRHTLPRRVETEEEPPKKPEGPVSTISSFFSRR